MSTETSDLNSLDLIPEVTDWSGAVRGKFAEHENTHRVEHRIALFDEKTRSFEKPSLRAETSYSFYDRSCLAGYAHLRHMLQRWVDRMPPGKRKDVVARMRHKGRGTPRRQQMFDGAFFELFVHEFLIGTGASIAVDPKVGARTPDFCVTEQSASGSEVKYFVEATNINLEGVESRSDWNEQQALDCLDEIDSPDYYLLVRTKGELVESPKRNALKAKFKKLIADADYERVCAIARLHGHWPGNLPGATYRQGNWELSGQLLPVSEERRPKKGRFVGVNPGRFSRSDPVSRIKRRLEDKSNRYKSLDRLIIALRGDWFLERDEVSEALFGRRSYEIPVPADPEALRLSLHGRDVQRLDGFWFNSGGPKNRNVIGVLVAWSLYPQNVGEANLTFFPNPYSIGSLPAWTDEVPRAIYRRDQVEFTAGSPAGVYANDHVPWPWPETWERERRVSARS